MMSLLATAPTENSTQLGALTVQRFQKAVNDKKALDWKELKATLKTVRVRFDEGSWTDGDYQGTVNETGLPHGTGKKTYFRGGGPYRYAAGTFYEGEWKDGLYHGRGRLVTVINESNNELRVEEVRADGIWRDGVFAKVDWTCRVQEVS
mmetsp:Transcript_63174/g.108494  ORF Transcript_63174/g.108494 Transcript_63174/m.108494 type:complete len:149 (+) Transcript_63174:214-660(+)